MPTALTSQQLASYKVNGFVSPVTVMTPDRAADYLSRFEKYESDNNGWYELSKGQKLYLLQTWVADIIRNDAILDAVADVLGPNILCWGTSLFVKDAQAPSFVSWHQDSTYWGLSKPDVVTAWVALSPANRTSGCMKMLPGSHLVDQLEHTDTLANHNLLTRGQEVAVDVNESDAVYIPLEPGQISLHNIRTVHASEPNQSDYRRVGLAIRYIAPHVKQVFADKDSAWLLRGEDTYGHFVHEVPPDNDMDPKAIAEYERVMALRQDVLYRGIQGAPAHTTLS